MDEIVINTSTVGTQGEPAVTGFTKIQFAVAWNDNGNIKAQIFTSEGGRSGSPFSVTAPTAPDVSASLPAIAESNFGLVVAWIEHVRGGEAQVKLRTFDADLLSPGPEVQVSTAAVERLQRPVLAKQSDGGFVLVWSDVRPDQRIRAQRFTPDGEKNGAEFRANTVAGLHRNPMAAGLRDGNLLIGWRARIADPLHIRFQLFNAQGAAVGGEQIHNVPVTTAAIAPLDTGGFVMAHVKSPDDLPNVDLRSTVQASLFRANGGFAGTTVAATTADPIQSSWPVVAALPGGRFLLAWTELNLNASPAVTNVMARVFSSSGTPLGQPVQINTTSGGERFSLSGTAIAEEAENAFFAWSEQHESGGAILPRSVRGRAMPIPLA